MCACDRPIGLNSQTRSSPASQVRTPRARQLTYSDFFVLSESFEDNVASAAVRPASVDEVREIVKLANETTVPLHAVSIGRNLGCVRRGCIAADAAGMAGPRRDSRAPSSWCAISSCVSHSAGSQAHEQDPRDQ